MVAVIGGGPAGMTVAFKMIKEGYDVTIFDERNTIS
jgi:pyridine nucleotide-disulfide oxidoreductase